MEPSGHLVQRSRSAPGRRGVGSGLRSLLGEVSGGSTDAARLIPPISENRADAPVLSCPGPSCGGRQSTNTTGGIGGSRHRGELPDATRDVITGGTYWRLTAPRRAA